MRAANKGHRALDRVALEQAVQVVRQGVVDRGLDRAVKAQYALLVGSASLVVRAVGDVVAQHLRLPLGKSLLVVKVFQRRLGICPVGASALAGGARRNRAHHLRALDDTQRGGAPAAQDGRIDQQHTACERGRQRRCHQADKAAKGMTRQKNRFTRPVNLGLREIDQLLHQMRPVVGNRVLGVVAEFLDGFDREATRFQALEQNTISAGGKAVGVGKDDGYGRHAQIKRSCGVLIFFSGRLRPLWVSSGTSVCSPFHIGSSMLSKTSRSFCPQLPCSMRK